MLHDVSIMNRKSFFTTLFGGLIGSKVVASIPKTPEPIVNKQPSHIQLECPTTGKKVLLGMNNGVFEIRYINQPIGEGLTMSYTPSEPDCITSKYSIHDANPAPYSMGTSFLKSKCVSFNF